MREASGMDAFIHAFNFNICKFEEEIKLADKILKYKQKIGTRRDCYQ